MKKLSLVLFDLDGTIIDNNEQYKQAFQEVLEKEFGKKVDNIALVGSIGVAPNWPILFKTYKIKTAKTPEELAFQTQLAYLTKLDEVKVRDGFFEFIQVLKEGEIAIALATSNDWLVVDKVLQKFNLEGLFDIITTSEEAKYLKPDPDIFLLTARKLDIDPKECVVIEDAPAGIEAAKSAGMKSILITKDYNDLSLKSLKML